MENEFVDYYKVLRVDPDASSEIMAAAYSILMQKTKPDTDETTMDVEERLLEYRKAYGILSIPESRESYHQEYALNLINKQLEQREFYRQTVFEELQRIDKEPPAKLRYESDFYQPHDWLVIDNHALKTYREEGWYCIKLSGETNYF